MSVFNDHRWKAKIGDPPLLQSFPPHPTPACSADLRVHAIANIVGSVLGIGLATMFADRWPLPK
jgi:hypothetical protein